MNIQTKQKALNALSEIWNLYNATPIHYRQQRDIYKKHRTTLTLSHLVKRSGFGSFPERGYFILHERPTTAMIEIISKFQSIYQKECSANRKSNKKEDTPTLFTNEIPSEQTIQSVIKHLKTLGYKLMKPIAPQFEEI